MAKFLIFKAIQIAVCQLYGFCLRQDDCPDGVCDDALKTLDGINEETPQPVMAPGKLQSFDFGEIDWTKLKELVDVTVLFFNTLQDFLGIRRRVGSGE